MATFERARLVALFAGPPSEIEWQRAAAPELFTETDLLREAAWVILCGGFREATVRKVFDYISLCFLDWETAADIVAAGDVCTLSASKVFNNPRKLAAIVDVAHCIEYSGFQTLKTSILEQPITELRRLPHVGEVTVWHLAKNLGFDVAKPDRHLVRMASDYGFSDPHAMCAALSHMTGEPVRVVDLVLWRYAAEGFAAKADAFVGPLPTSPF